MTRPKSSGAPTSLAFAAGAFGLALGATGCGDDLDRPPGTEMAEADNLHLGRVHVVLEPGDVLGAGDDGHLQVTARFAFVRGLDEEFVRARIDMPLLAHEVLPRGECTAEDLARGLDVEAEPSADRELVLVDAGNLRIHAGDATLRVPLSLVPDLLPYMSGVEYVYYGDSLPSSDTEHAGSLVVEAEGSRSDELPAFSAEASLPPSPSVFFLEEDLDDLTRNALVLRWTEGDDPEAPLTLRLTPLVGDEPAGDELTCVFDDLGQARVDMQVLRTLGLPERTEALLVTASRATLTTFDAGAFAGSEFVVERRSTTVLPLGRAF